MRLTMPLLLASLPLLTACNILSTETEVVEDGPRVVNSSALHRVRGQLENTGSVLLKPCNGSESLPLDTSTDPDLMARMVAALLAGDTRSQFIDLLGREVTTEDGERRLVPERIYRLEGESLGCSDEEFPRLVVSASGNEPSWMVRVLPKGMLLQRLEQPELALPYVEESLPDGSMGFTSEADGNRVELWLTPSRCQDSMSDSVYHLSASLRINTEKPLTGCAALGGARQ